MKNLFSVKNGLQVVVTRLLGTYAQHTWSGMYFSGKRGGEHYGRIFVVNCEFVLFHLFGLVVHNRSSRIIFISRKVVDHFIGSSFFFVLFSREIKNRSRKIRAQPSLGFVF